jgi:hypothetical protein
MKFVKVEDQYRTNPLSHEPGGSEVTVYMDYGSVYVYDKIKNPTRYIGSLPKRDSIIRIDLDSRQVWDVNVDSKPFWEI